MYQYSVPLFRQRLFEALEYKRLSYVQLLYSSECLPFNLTGFCLFWLVFFKVEDWIEFPKLSYTSKSLFNA
jgi:riboflavin transporter FmnP